MRIRTKKVVLIALALLLVVSLVTACTSRDAVDRDAAKLEVDNYVASLNSADYLADNWALILEYQTQAKIDIDAASTQEEVDDIVKTFKEDVSKVAKLEPVEVPDELTVFVNGELADELYYVDLQADAYAHYESEKEKGIVVAFLNSLNGLLAQQGETSFLISRQNSTAHWKATLETNYGLTFTDLTGEPILEIARRFIDAGKISGEFAAYSFGTESINAATMVAAVEQYLLIDPSGILFAEMEALEDSPFALGASELADCRALTEASVFEEVKDQLNKGIVINQHTDYGELRDYAIAAKLPIVWNCDAESSLPTSMSNLAAWIGKDNIPVLGWNDNEVAFVRMLSQNGMYMIASDGLMNLTFFAAMRDVVEEKLTEGIQQVNYEKQETEAENGKHYVALVMSDGDNIMWMESGFNGKQFIGSDHVGKFPVTWSMAPSLAQVAPAVVDSIYRQGSEKDYFIASSTGIGYMNPGEYKPSAISSYVATTEAYMKASDQKHIAWIDNPAGGVITDKSMINAFASSDQIQGGLLMLGDRYTEGNGGVYWSDNGKPFLAVKDTLWSINNDTTPEMVARRVRKYAEISTAMENSKSQIESYTVVICHAWSIGNMSGMNRFYEHLKDDQNIEFVTLDTMLDMVSQNVAKQDKTSSSTPYRTQADAFDYTNMPEVDYLELDTMYSEALENGISDKTVWTFTPDEKLNGWLGWNMGKQYDNLEWRATYGGIVYFDGSDLQGEGNTDLEANSAIYQLIRIPETADNLFLNLSLRPNNVEFNYRVRFVVQEGDQFVSTVITPENYPDDPAKQGWYYVNDAADPAVFTTYSIPIANEYKGMVVMAVVEFDDPSDGMGRLMFCNKIEISNQSSDPMQTPVFGGMTRQDVSDILAEEASISADTSLAVDFSGDLSAWSFRTVHGSAAAEQTKDGALLSLPSSVAADNQPYAYLAVKIVFPADRAANLALTLTGARIGDLNTQSSFNVWFIGSNYAVTPIGNPTVVEGTGERTLLIPVPSSAHGIADQAAYLMVLGLIPDGQADQTADVEQICLKSLTGQGIVDYGSEALEGTNGRITLTDVGNLAPVSKSLYKVANGAEGINLTPFDQVNWKITDYGKGGGVRLDGLGLTYDCGTADPTNRVSDGPHAGFYTRTVLSEDATTFGLWLRAHEDGANWRDIALRMRVVPIITGEDGSISFGTAVTLSLSSLPDDVLEGEEGYGDFYRVLGPAYRDLQFDVSAFCGQDVLLVVEMAMDGQGSQTYVTASGQEVGISAIDYLFMAAAYLGEKPTW